MINLKLEPADDDVRETLRNARGSPVAAGAQGHRCAACPQHRRREEHLRRPSHSKQVFAALCGLTAIHLCCRRRGGAGGGRGSPASAVAGADAWLVSPQQRLLSLPFFRQPALSGFLFSMPFVGWRTSCACSCACTSRSHYCCSSCCSSCCSCSSSCSSCSFTCISCTSCSSCDCSCSTSSRFGCCHARRRGKHQRAVGRCETSWPARFLPDKLLPFTAFP